MFNLLTLTPPVLITFYYNFVIFSINASSVEQLFSLKKASVIYTLYTVLKTSMKLSSIINK